MPPPHSCLFEVPDCHTSNSSEPVFICGPTDQSEVWRPVILVGSTTKSDQHHPTSQDKILGRILNESGHVTTPWVLPPISLRICFHRICSGLLGVFERQRLSWLSWYHLFMDHNWLPPMGYLEQVHGLASVKYSMMLEHNAKTEGVDGHITCSRLKLLNA